MDPEIALLELRELAADLYWSQGESARMSELFTSLDEWLTSGGFLPVDWTRR